MQELLNQLTTTATGLALLAGTYLVWLLTGMANNLFSVKKWSWKRTLEDIAKTTLMAMAILAWVAVCYGLNWFSTAMGADISALLDGASTAGVIGGIIGGTAWYLIKAYKNIINFVNANHIEVKIENPDYAKVAGTVTNVISGMFAKHDNSLNVEALTPEVGASPYYEVDVSTPTKFYNAVNGKGFDEGWGMQCVAGFKEFMFSLSGRYVSAGGAAKNYATAQSIVEPLGFKWHDGMSDLQDGDWGIWTGGGVGHVAMYYQGKWFGQNQGAKDGNVGNPFNLMSLPTSDLVGYYRPNIYKDQAPAPKPQPKPSKREISYTYKQGDTFGQVVTDLGLKTSHGLWGPDGDVAYYTEQLHKQGIYGNIPVGTTIKLTPRTD